MIFVAKRLASAGSRYDIGFQTGYPNSQYVAHIRNNTNDTYYRLITSAGTTSNATDFSIAEDNDFHTGKIINKERSVLGYLDTDALSLIGDKSYDMRRSSITVPLENESRQR